MKRRYQTLSTKAACDVAADDTGSNSSQLLEALRSVQDLIGPGDWLIDRLMTSSIDKVKLELQSKQNMKDLPNRYKSLNEQVLRLKGSDADDSALVKDARASLESAKILIACQSCDWDFI